jgi:predicted PurR-regulated permease PerM
MATSKQKSPVGADRFKQTSLTIVGVIAVLYLGREVLIPIALAALFSFLLAPPMVRLQRLGLGKTFSALAVVIISFSVLAVICWAGLGEAYTLAQELPLYRENITSKLKSVTPIGLSRLAETKHMLGEVSGALVPTSSQSAQGRNGGSTQKPIPVEVHQPEPAPLQFLKETAGSILAPVATAFIVLVFVVFMLLGREDLRDRVLRLAGSNRLFMTTQALDDAARRVSRYLVMQFAVNAVYGSLVGFALLFIGVPHPLVWGGLAMLLRFIPYVGPWIAAAGPLLLSIGVAPGWGRFAWTLGTYVTLELLAANVVEPYLYGSSTGISAIAILVAAVFWTWLWGPIGLLLSTPLTVCAVVIGRYVPHLEFLGILFGDEPALSPAQRFYQRLIARDAEDAAELIDELMKDHSVPDLYDDVLIPAVSLVEEGRYAGLLDAETENYFLENTRELIEEVGWRERENGERTVPATRILCVAAKNAADELMCRMLAQVLTGSDVQVLPVGISREDLTRALSTGDYDIVCVSGVPPHAVRHVAVRCRHVRRLHREVTIMAAVWSQSDLNAIRSRISVVDANHVVCNMKQAIEYVSNAAGAPPVPEKVAAEQTDNATEKVADFQLLNVSSSPLQEVLNKILQDLASALETPIAVLSVEGEGGKTWRAQCGVPDDLRPGLDQIKRDIQSLTQKNRDSIVAEDIASDPRFSQGSILREKGIRFCMLRALINASGKTVGYLLVLDTRTRSTSERDEELLRAAATAVVEAIEVRQVAPAPSEEKQPA